MDRKPEHLIEDPHLRLEFVNQTSLDEFLESGVELDIDVEGLTAEELASAIRLAWRHNLLPGTNVAEFFYLSGYPDLTSRQAVIDQSHAETTYALKRATAQDN